MTESRMFYKTPEGAARRCDPMPAPLSEQARLPVQVTRTMRGIRGLTDRMAEFPRIGELRKGAKKISDKEPGKDLGPYFRFTSDQAETVADFEAVYGEAPTEVSVYLPYRYAEDNFMTAKEQWVAGGMVHRCDGVTCSVWRKPGDTGYSIDPVPCPGGCTPVGRLKVIIPDLMRMALVTALTSSKHDLMRITEQLAAYEAIRGDLRGIQFVLSRRRVKVSTPEIGSDKKQTGKRVRREKWLLSIEPAKDWVVAQVEAMRLAAMPRLPQIEAPDVVEGETADAAFVPEDADTQPEPEDDNGYVDGDGVIAEVAAAEQPEPTPAEPTRRDKLVSRLGEIERDLKAIGQNVILDAAWLTDATEEQLIAEGQRMKRRLDQARKAQVTLDAVSNKPSEAVQ